MAASVSLPRCPSSAIRSSFIPPTFSAVSPLRRPPTSAIPPCVPHLLSGHSSEPHQVHPSRRTSRGISSFVTHCSSSQENSVSMAAASTQTLIPPAIIVGAGRVGLALAKMGNGDFLVKRGEAIVPDAAPPSGPIIICTRNDALESIIDATPARRRDDLVFIQNGMLEPLLGSKGLAHSTQVLVYFAVAKLGEDPTDGKTDLNPEGLTTATGKWAQSVADRLHSKGLSCHVVEGEEFTKRQLEKLIWISAFMLVGVHSGGVSVGEVEAAHAEEVDQLVRELASAAEEEKGVKFDGGLEERLRAYARSVAHYPTALKEFSWRNGWFWSMSQRQLARGQRDPTPLHSAWLQEMKAV
eukprot:TRINITY_DN10167_c0_g1_i1.p1 TRINITY_DN10167_c0_g1~~TRINITY_DN10167_c0_g1_i1.p1  ORF type:complete len:354 (+),score=67.24 TRINITY_DN10167_c0_g1_i1:41-1102(+)